MARRSTLSPAKPAFAPPSDPATYSDLLLFENRLKGNALSLNRRKSRYQFFLAQLILVICFLLSEVLLQTSFLIIPYKLVLCYVFPEVYPSTADVDAQLHPYFTSGLLFVAVTTLVLFLATGVYAEKIGYANRYVPHANRALRSFNMFLNMRTAPRRSTFNPLSYLFARPPLSPTPPSRPSSRSPTPSGTPSGTPNRRTPSPSPSPGRRTPTPTWQPRTSDPQLSLNPVTSNIGTTNIPALPIPTIPPTTNPRGELIFSSRVDRNFRDGYAKYRAAFERRREQREREAWEKTWVGWMSTARVWPWNWRRSGIIPEKGIEGGGGGAGSSTPTSRAASLREKGEVGVGRSPSRTGSARGRGQRTGGDNTTPTSSRRSTPAPPSPASSLPSAQQAHAMGATSRPPPGYL